MRERLPETVETDGHGDEREEHGEGGRDAPGTRAMMFDESEKTGRRERAQSLVVEEQQAKQHGQQIEEIETAGRDDHELKDQHAPGEEHARPARQKNHEGEDDFEDERRRGSGMQHGFRQQARGPRKGRGQRLRPEMRVERGEPLPALIAGEKFCRAGEKEKAEGQKSKEENQNRENPPSERWRGNPSREATGPIGSSRKSVPRRRATDKARRRGSAPAARSN